MGSIDRSTVVRKIAISLVGLASAFAFSPSADALELRGIDAQDADLRVRLVERRGVRPRNRGHHLVKVESSRGSASAEFFCDLSGVSNRDGTYEFAECHKLVSSVSGDDDESLSFELHLGGHGGFSIRNVSVTGDQTALGDDLRVLIGRREVTARGLRIELDPQGSVDASESIGVVRLAALATQRMVGLEVPRVVRFRGETHELRLPIESLRWSIDGTRNLTATGRLDVSSIEGARIEDVYQSSEVTLLSNPSNLDSTLLGTDALAAGLRRGLLAPRIQRR